MSVVYRETKGTTVGDEGEKSKSSSEARRLILRCSWGCVLPGPIVHQFTKLVPDLEIGRLFDAGEKQRLHGVSPALR